MAERIDVMISSTARDLPLHRKEAYEACVRQGMFPIMMEYLPATGDDAIAVSMTMVDEAEIYLGIVAYRYGYVPEGYDISITEMEYNRALERGIPRLIFIMSDEHEQIHTYNQGNADSGEKAKKLQAFKQRLQTDQVVNFFKSPADLRALIINSLSHYHQRDVTGFHRAIDIPTAPQPYIAHPYTLLEAEALLGRKQELEALTAWVSDSEQDLYQARVLSLVAIGGMGKSALTWKWFNDVVPHVMPTLAGRMWWSFYESDAHLVNFIVRALSYVTGQPEKDIRKLSRPEAENQLLTVLNQEPYLIVMDGLERLLLAYAHPEAARMIDTAFKTMAKVLRTTPRLSQHRLRKTADPRAGNFLRKLLSVKESRILISTRLFPADLETPSGHVRSGCAMLELTGLADADALKLWRSFGVSGSKESLKELFHTFENYPLLIRALAGEVARYRRAPGNFDRWKKAHREFNPYELPMIQRQSHILEFALRSLDEKTLEVLRTIAAFRAPASYDTLADLLVGDMMGDLLDSEDELDEALTTLEDRGLVGWDRSANRYDLHPVVRGVTWSGLNARDKKSMYQKLQGHFEAIPPIGDWRRVNHLEDLTASLELYHTLIGLERYDEACEVFIKHLNRPLTYRLSNSVKRIELLEALFPDGVDKLPRLQKPNQQTWALNALGRAYQASGQPGRAAPFFRRSNEIQEKISYTIDLSSGLRDLSYALRVSGVLWEAEAAARRAVLLDRNDEDRLQEALSLQVLGLALAARGVKKESAEALDRSLRLAEVTDANRAFNHHAIRALWFDDYEKAEEWAAKGLQYARQIRYEAGMVLAMRLRGEALTRSGKADEAEQNLHEALSRARSATLVEAELESLVALAKLRYQQGQLDMARELLDEVWESAENGPYPLIEADGRNLLAKIHLMKGQPEQAIEAILKACHLAWCEGEPYAYAAALKATRELLTGLNVSPPDNLPGFRRRKMVKLVINPPDEFH